MKIKAKLMNEADIKRTLNRIVSEILETNPVIEDLVIMGVKTRGEPLARYIKNQIKKETQKDIPVGALDITFYRDDLSMIGEKPIVKETNLPCNINNRVVILVDDVLYTGRTVRAAMDELMDYGRPKAIKLCVLCDRGHRELPICPDYVGKYIKTLNDEVIIVKIKEIDNVSEVVITQK